MKNLSLILIILITNICFAADKFNWPAYEKKEIPDSLKNENAIYLQNVTTIDFNNAGETNWIVFKRIAINSKSSAEELSKQIFYIPNDGRLERMFGRIIKKDGSIIEIEEIDKFKTKITEKNDYETSTLTKYQVLFPNVENGDVIDLYYETKLDGYIYSSILYLEDEYNSLYSRITLRNYSLLDINAMVVNQKEQPSMIMNAGVPTINWIKEGVKKTKSDYFNAPTPTQPCLIFNLWSPQETLNYKVVFNYDAVKYPSNYASLESLKKNILAANVFSDEDPVALKVQKLVKYFEDEFTWDNTLKLEPVFKASNYFKNKTINQDIFFFYIQKLLTEENTEFYRSYSKNLLEGRFVHGIVALEQLDNRYLLFIDESNAEHFIFQPTSSGRYYYLDEIPFYCEGNQSIAMKGKNLTLEDLLQVNLPQSSLTDNTHYAKCMLKITNDGNVKMTRDDDLSGHYSTIFRGPSESYWLKEFNIADTLLNAIHQNELYPYNKKYKQDTLLKFELNSLNDSLSWFSLKDFLPHSFFIEEEEEIEMGNYIVFPFTKTEGLNFYVTGDNAINLAEKFSDKLTNSVGNVAVNCIQMSENMLKINYEMKLEKRILTSEEEVEHFKSLVLFWKNIRDKKWIVSVK